MLYFWLNLMKNKVIFFLFFPGVKFSMAISYSNFLNAFVNFKIKT